MDGMQRFMRMGMCALLPRRATLTRKLADGTIVGGPNRNGYGGRGVFVFGDEIEPEFANLNAFLGRDNVLIDVGANTGIYSMKGARIVGDGGIVLSLEPNPVMLAVLEQNVRRNGYNNVRLRGIAASDRCGEFSFYMNFGKPNSFSLVRAANCSNKFSVLAVDLDSLIDWERLDRVDLLKIDAEGAEAQILRGASTLIGKHRPIIIAEVSVKRLGDLPSGYVAFGPPQSLNWVMVPDGDLRAARIKAIGWPRVEI
jgi:FkbM family methyltransferase